jgi:hypothetical protein
MTTKLDMIGVREERFKGLMYHQGVSIRYEGVEASNSYVRTLIFGSFFLLSSVKVFFPPFFAFFFGLVFYCLFSFCQISFCFYRLSFFLFFLTLFYSCFFISCSFMSSLLQLAWD